MKAIANLMFRWACVMGTGIVLLSLDYAPVIDAYREMSARQVTIYLVMGLLFGGWVIILWAENRARRALNVRLNKPRAKAAVKAPAGLILHYVGDGKNGMLQMPVDSMWHAQDLLDVMGVRNAAVTDGMTGEQIYGTDAHGTLVQV